LLPAAVACSRPVSKNRSVKKWPVLAKRTRRSRESNQCRFRPNEPNQIWRRPARCRTSLGRDSARIIISAIIEGFRHNDSRHFPQTKPISANEANGEKPKETTLQDEQHAPLRSGARTRLLFACSGAAGSAFCQPVQMDDEGSPVTFTFYREPVVLLLFAGCPCSWPVVSGLHGMRSRNRRILLR
jgi:hypothetical protein